MKRCDLKSLVSLVMCCRLCFVGTLTCQLKFSCQSMSCGMVRLLLSSFLFHKNALPFHKLQLFLSVLRNCACRFKAVSSSRGLCPHELGAASWTLKKSSIEESQGNLQVKAQGPQDVRIFGSNVRAYASLIISYLMLSVASESTVFPACLLHVPTLTL